MRIEEGAFRPGAVRGETLSAAELRDLHERSEGISEYLTEIFRPYKNSSNATELKELIDDRTDILARDYGETRESLEALFSKGTLMDTVASAFIGGFGALAFAAAGLVNDRTSLVDILVAALDHIPGMEKLPPSIKRGFVAGVISGILDDVWEKARESAMMNAHLLSGAPAQMAAAMREARDAMEPSAFRRLLEYAIAIQFFRLGDATNTIAQLFGFSSLATSLVNAVSKPISGAGYVASVKKFDDRHHRSGAAVLLGRTDDWEDRYRELADRTWADAVANGLGRAGKTIVNTPEAVLGAVHWLSSARRFAKVFGALGCGTANSTFVEAETKKATSQWASEALKVVTVNFARAAASSGTSAAWTTAVLATDDVVGAMREQLDKAGDWTQRVVAQGVRAGIGGAAQTGLAGVGAVAGGGRAALRAANRWGNSATQLVSSAAQYTNRLGELWLRGGATPSSTRLTAEPSSANLQADTSIPLGTIDPSEMV